MDSLLKKLKAGKDNKKIIEFPGTGHNVMLKVLTEKEKQEASFAANEFVRRAVSKEVYDSNASRELYLHELLYQSLWRSLYDPDDENSRLATNCDELKKFITGEERSYFMDEYDVFEAECSPNIDRMSEDEFNKLLADIKKKPDETALNVSNINLARRLIISLASQG